MLAHDAAPLVVKVAWPEVLASLGQTTLLALDLDDPDRGVLYELRRQSLWALAGGMWLATDAFDALTAVPPIVFPERCLQLRLTTPRAPMHRSVCDLAPQSMRRTASANAAAQDAAAPHGT